MSNEKAIKIIYANYETIQDGAIRWRDREAIIHFSKDTTEYVTNQSYKDNMEAMMLDIFENGYVFITDKLAVPIFNIKQFMAFDETSKEKPIVEQRDNKRFNRWNKKKFHGRRPDDRGTQEKKEPVIANAEDFPVKESEKVEKKEEPVVDKSAPIL